MATQIKLRRDTAANWTSNNPTLASGEPGVETDTGILKIGNGTDAWDDLDGISGGSSAGGGMEIGTIFPYAGTVAPVGSFICDGSALSRTTYADLFAAIGTTWGVGDGSTTFNIPDLQGAFLRGTGSHGTNNMANGSDFAGPSVGSFENDQMQGHYHDVDADNGIDLGLAGSPSGSGDYNIYRGPMAVTSEATPRATAPVQGTDGPAREGDETRPFNAGVTYCIKATPATNSGDPLPTYSYSTGWVQASSGWQNKEFTVTHGLNTPLTDLIVELFVSSDGTEANATSVLDTTTSTTTGITSLAIDNSSFKIQTQNNGFTIVRDDGSAIILDTETGYYYKVKVYRPEVLASELSTTSYDTDWQTLPSAGSSSTITHSLGTDRDDLIVEAQVRDGSSNQSDLVWYYDSSAGTEERGEIILPNDTNSILFQVSAGGARGINSSGVAFVPTEYRVVVYKPELISSVTPAAVKSVSDDYTITGRTDSRIIQVTTGASDYTITLPSSTGLVAGDEFEVMKADSGAGEVTIASTDLIKNNVILGSEGDFLKVRWTGSQFNFVDYYAHGSNSDGEWERRMFKQECRIQEASAAVNQTFNANIGTYGWSFYYEASTYAWTYAKAFSSNPTLLSNGSSTGTASGEFIMFSSKTTTGANVSIRGFMSTTLSFSLFATGEW